MKYEDICGNFEDVVVLFCETCKEERVSKFDEFDQNCPCGETDPQVKKAVRFDCPKCQHKNVVVQEPKEVGKAGGFRFLLIENSSVICNECLEEYQMVHMIPTESDIICPDRWVRGLVKPKE